MKNLTFLFFLGIAQISLAQNNSFTIGQEFTFQSEVLNETRTYVISLPSSYENDPFYINKKYPILILLDGERLFHPVSGMVQTMSHGSIEQIPEMIIVGVYNTNRNRDMIPTRSTTSSDGRTLEQLSESGGADLFNQFLVEELIPEIQKEYRVSDCKILVGHSFAGLFAAYDFSQKQNFDAYLAIDPSLWWDDEMINELLRSQIVNEKKPAGNIYISQANNPFDPGKNVTRAGTAIQNFKSILDANASYRLHYHFDFFEKEDHFSVPLVSIYEGLQFLFRGYQFPLDQVPKSEGGAIILHYEKFSNRFNNQIQPPGKLLNQVGNFLFRQEGQFERALEILKVNSIYYPNTEIPFQSLGNAYLQNGETQLAISNFEKVLKLNPNNEQARTRLNELRNN